MVQRPPKNGSSSKCLLGLGSNWTHKMDKPQGFQSISRFSLWRVRGSPRNGITQKWFHTVDGYEIRFAPRYEAMVGAVVLRVFLGESSFQDFLGGAVQGLSIHCIFWALSSSKGSRASIRACKGHVLEGEQEAASLLGAGVRQGATWFACLLDRPNGHSSFWGSSIHFQEQTDPSLGVGMGWMHSGTDRC